MVINGLEEGMPKERICMKLQKRSSIEEKSRRIL